MAYFPLNVRQDALPVQMLPMKDKDDEWKRACMDALESIGRKQFLENINILIVYYKIRISTELAVSSFRKFFSFIK